jgi:hypothetical protein
VRAKKIKHTEMLIEPSKDHLYLHFTSEPGIWRHNCPCPFSTRCPYGETCHFNKTAQDDEDTFTSLQKTFYKNSATGIERRDYVTLPKPDYLHFESYMRRKRTPLKVSVCRYSHSSTTERQQCEECDNGLTHSHSELIKQFYDESVISYFKKRFSLPYKMRLVPNMVRCIKCGAMEMCYIDPRIIVHEGLCLVEPYISITCFTCKDVFCVNIYSL